MSAGLGAWLVLIVVPTLAVCAQYPALLRGERATLRQARVAYRWISRNVPEHASLLASRDALMYLYTGRQGILFLVPPKLLYSQDRQATLEWVGSMVDYAIAYRTSYLLLEWIQRGDAERAGKDLDREQVLRKAFRTVGGVLRGDPRVRLVSDSGKWSVFRIEAQ